MVQPPFHFKVSGVTLYPESPYCSPDDACGADGCERSLSWPWAAPRACMAGRPGRGESVGKCSQPPQHLVLLNFSAGCRASFVRSHCSSAEPVSHQDAKFCHKETGLCGLLSVVFDTIKPLSEVMFGKKNRSVVNQN